MAKSVWTLPFGTNVFTNEKGKQATEFRVWAPKARLVELERIVDGQQPVHDQMHLGDNDVFWIERSDCPPGTRYKYRLDGRQSFPDPWSRRQPDGVHGASEVIDPREHDWSDGAWADLKPTGLVIYECHVGTFSKDGTFDEVRDKLGHLKDLGINALQLMPVAAFPGRWGWGYDGVELFAPFEPYGGPRGLKRLVDAAHGKGIAVLLDVVYNHLGPDGNYLGVYSGDYFTDRYHTPWGAAANFRRTDGPGMRQLVIENACYWLHEYHLDGLRLDATHAIFDDSDPHILKELTERARASVDRPVVIIAENESNETPLIEAPRAAGAGLDGIWADDFHHQLRVFLTGERDGYYHDFSGTLADIGRTVAGGFFYQGQHSQYLGRNRGHPTHDTPARKFVFCLQNHDQVGNRAFGERLNQQIDLDSYLVASLLLLTVPETPLLFMGQEFASGSPFLYFTDHNPELGRLVTAGRREEFKRFTAFQDPALRARIPDPQAESTYRNSQLDWADAKIHAGVFRLYQDALKMRREDPVLVEQSRERLHWLSIGSRAFALYLWHGPEHRLLVGNFGEPIEVSFDSLLPVGHPLLAGWHIELQTRDERYARTNPELVVLKQPEGELSLAVPARTGVWLAAQGA